MPAPNLPGASAWRQTCSPHVTHKLVLKPKLVPREEVEGWAAEESENSGKAMLELGLPEEEEHQGRGTEGRETVVCSRGHVREGAQSLERSRT